MTQFHSFIPLITQKIKIFTENVIFVTVGFKKPYPVLNLLCDLNFITMETSTGARRLPTPAIGLNPIEVDNKIKRKLLKQGVSPTPKIIHTLRKKNLQKTLRKSKKLSLSSPEPSLSDSQKQELAEEAHFQTLKAEYKTFSKAINAKMTGKPWERLERGKLRELSSLSNEYGGEKLKSEHLRELSHILEIERDTFRWLLDDDIELEPGLLDDQRPNWTPPKRRGGDSEAIQFLVDRYASDKVLRV